MIDSHCHLADDVFAADLEQVVTRAREAGLSSAMCILSAHEPEELARVPALRAAWPALHFAAAVHPHHSGHYAGRPHEAGETTARTVLASDAVGVGEIGLDYHYDFAPREVQRAVFEAQIAAALDLGRPVVIHTREAFDDTVDVLKSAGQGRIRGVMHCFSGTLDEARRSLDIGFYVSMSGIMTFPKAEALREVARFVPADRLLIETDAPYLAPVPYRGKRNEPGWVAETLKRLAEVRGDTVAATDAQTTANFQQLVLSRAENPLAP